MRKYLKSLMFIDIKMLNQKEINFLKGTETA